LSALFAVPVLPCHPSSNRGGGYCRETIFARPWFDASKTSALALVSLFLLQTLRSEFNAHFLDQNLHLAHQLAGTYAWFSLVFSKLALET